MVTVIKKKPRRQQQQQKKTQHPNQSVFAYNFWAGRSSTCGK